MKLLPNILFLLPILQVSSLHPCSLPSSLLLESTNPNSQLSLRLGLSIKSIASTSSLERQSRFAGFHAFNPVPQMKLVEVIQTDLTSDETRDALLELCKKMKKTPVQCKDTPG